MSNLDLDELEYVDTNVSDADTVQRRLDYLDARNAKLIHDCNELSDDMLRLVKRLSRLIQYMDNRLLQDEVRHELTRVNRKHRLVRRIP